MYKKKLKEQINKLEKMQAKCKICDVSEFKELSIGILQYAEKLDFVNKKAEKLK